MAEFCTNIVRKQKRYALHVVSGITIVVSAVRGNLVPFVSFSKSAIPSPHAQLRYLLLTTHSNNNTEPPTTNHRHTMT